MPRSVLISARTRCVISGVALIALATNAAADLTYNVDTNGWPNTAQRNAAVSAIQAVTTRYNAYGDFGNSNIYVYYNAGIPTAQASYLGSIGFGGTYPNERVTQHELAHYLGLPSTGWMISGGVWTGALATAQVRQFEGEAANLHGDSIHFWPYGLNYDSEGSELNKQRQVAMVYAMRADLGIGSSAHPSAAPLVTQTGSDPSGQSGFNYQDRWSDGYFPHEGADYFTNDFLLRTPASDQSFRFYGDSLTVNNTNGASGGLAYSSSGSSAVTTIDNLILDGGWIQHVSSVNDVFQLDGVLEVVSDATLCAKQGNIDILADVTGSGALTIAPTDLPDEDDRYVSLSSANNSFIGDIDNQARFELTDGANFTFVIGSAGINNTISGASARLTQLNGQLEIDLSGASANPGDAWSLISAANVRYGRRFSVVGFDKRNGIWINGEYKFSQTTGLLTLVTEWQANGSGLWSNAGNWTAGVPEASDDAKLGNLPSTATVIDLDVPATLNRLTIDNLSNPYVLNGSNPITLASTAELRVKSGAHVINVPIAGAAGLTKSGAGAVALSAANTYSGDTQIEAGSLALTGVGSLANSMYINVTPGATFGVAGLNSPFELGSGQTLNNDANVVGDVIATNGAQITGAGAFADSVTLQGGSTMRIGGAGITVDSTYVLIDDFNAYDNSTNQNIGAHSNGDATNGVWDGVFDGTGYATIQDNDAASDNALEVAGIPDQGAGGWRGAITDLANRFPTDLSLADGETATYFFQVLSEGNAYTDTVLGLTESLATVDINDAWQDFAVRPSVVGSSRSTVLKVGSLTVTSLVSGQWQNVWLVVDNASKTYDVYTSTGVDDGVLVYSNVGFYPIDNPAALTAFGIMDREDGRVRLDNLFRADGHNTTNPLGALGGMLYVPEAITVDGDATLMSGATLAVDIATADTNDWLEVSGNFAAGGTLALTLDPAAPLPQASDSYDLIDAASFSGAFEAFALPALAGGEIWDARELYTTGVIAVSSTSDILDASLDCFAGPDNALPGGCSDQDLDGDNDDDVSDFARWQACVTNSAGILTPDCLAK